MTDKKKLSKKIIALIVCGAIIATLLLACLGAEIAFLVEDNKERWHPSYDMVDISDILKKDGLEDSDYQTLYEQTGLTKVGVDRALARGQYGINRILQIQKDYFEDYKIEHVKLAPFTCMDFLEKAISPVFLKDGDIVVSACTTISGWRLGHSGIITDGPGERVLHALTYGTESHTDNVSYFTATNAFIILEVDTDRQNEVVEYAKENLFGIPYEGTAGLFTDKNKIKKTQCAHLVWYAYKQIGIDLDSTGGPIVTPKDIANSPHVKVVQIYGFDPEKLWN